MDLGGSGEVETGFFCGYFCRVSHANYDVDSHFMLYFDDCNALARMRRQFSNLQQACDVVAIPRDWYLCLMLRLAKIQI